MLLVVFCALASLFAAIAAFRVLAKRKFYREHTTKMSGKVTQHSKVTIMGEDAYELFVLAENCFTYKITTKCSAAKKLTEGTAVDILVPDLAEPETGDIIREDLEEKEAEGRLRADEAETLRLLRELEEVTKKVQSMSAPDEKRVILCKESVPVSKFWLNAGISAVFFMFNLVLLITMIIDKKTVL